MNEFDISKYFTLVEELEPLKYVLLLLVRFVILLKGDLPLLLDI